MRMHQALTHYLHGLPYGDCNYEEGVNRLGGGYISIWFKEGSSIISSVVRGKISDVRGVCGGWIIRWGCIRGKFGIY